MFQRTGDWNPFKLIIMTYYAVFESLLMLWVARYRLRVIPTYLFLITRILTVFGSFFRLRNLSIAWDLLSQTGLDRDFCKLYVALPFEGRCSTIITHVYFVRTWYEWFEELGQRTTLKVHSCSNNFFVFFSNANAKLVLTLRCKKDWQTRYEKFHRDRLGRNRENDS